MSKCLKNFFRKCFMGVNMYQNCLCRQKSTSFFFNFQTILTLNLFEILPLAGYKIHKIRWGFNFRLYIAKVTTWPYSANIKISQEFGRHQPIRKAGGNIKALLTTSKTSVNMSKTSCNISSGNSKATYYKQVICWYTKNQSDRMLFFRQRSLKLPRLYLQIR